MFMKVNTKSFGTEMLINTSQITWIRPEADHDGEYTTICMVNGYELAVLQEYEEISIVIFVSEGQARHQVEHKLSPETKNTITEIINNN